MCPQYDYHQREHNTSWQLVHIEVLLEEAENVASQEKASSVLLKEEIEKLKVY